MSGSPIPPVTPPTSPAAVQRQEKAATWPTVLGIIITVLGGLGLLGNVFTLGMSHFFSDTTFPPVTTSTTTQIGSSTTTHMTTVHVTDVQADTSWDEQSNKLIGVQAALAILLLVAGIGMLNRRRWSVRLALVWSVVKIPLEVLALVVGYLAFQEVYETQMAAMGQGPAAPMTFGGGFESFALIGFVMALIWGMALPVFLLIWFSRLRVREEIGRWGMKHRDVGGGSP